MVTIWQSCSRQFQLAEQPVRDHLPYLMSGTLCVLHIKFARLPNAIQLSRIDTATEQPQDKGTLSSIGDFPTLYPPLQDLAQEHGTS